DCFHPVSNWGPFACEANVITTTLWKQITLALAPFGTEEILESGSSEGLVPRQTTSSNKRLFPPSFELGTFRVLGERDKPLHYGNRYGRPWPRLELKRCCKVDLVRDLCQDRPHP